MKLFIEKDKCKIAESLNGMFLEIETDFEIEFIGRDGGDYILFDEDDEGICPAPRKPFVVELSKKEEPNNG